MRKDDFVLVFEKKYSSGVKRAEWCNGMLHLHYLWNARKRQPKSPDYIVTEPCKCEKHSEAA